MASPSGFPLSLAKKTTASLAKKTQDDTEPREEDKTTASPSGFPLSLAKKTLSLTRRRQVRSQWIPIEPREEDKTTASPSGFPLSLAKKTPTWIPTEPREQDTERRQDEGKSQWIPTEPREQYAKSRRIAQPSLGKLITGSLNQREKESVLVPSASGGGEGETDKVVACLRSIKLLRTDLPSGARPKEGVTKTSAGSNEDGKMNSQVRKESRIILPILANPPCLARRMDRPYKFIAYVHPGISNNSNVNCGREQSSTVDGDVEMVSDYAYEQDKPEQLPASNDANAMDVANPPTRQVNMQEAANNGIHAESTNNGKHAESTTNAPELAATTRRTSTFGMNVDTESASTSRDVHANSGDRFNARYGGLYCSNAQANANVLYNATANAIANVPVNPVYYLPDARARGRLHGTRLNMEMPHTTFEQCSSGSTNNLDFSASTLNAVTDRATMPRTSSSGGSNTLNFSASTLSASTLEERSSLGGTNMLDFSASTLNADTDHVTMPLTSSSSSGGTNTLDFSTSTLNASTDEVTIPRTTGPAEPKYQAANYIDATPAQKTAAVHRLVNGAYLSSNVLRALTTLHDGVTANDKSMDGKQQRKSTQRLKDDFLSHSCTESCLLSKEAARQSGTTGIDLGTDKFLAAAGILKLRLGLNTRTGEKRKQAEDGEKRPAKKKRTDCNGSERQENTKDKQDTRAQPFELTSEDEKKQILLEFIEATSNSAVKKKMCSFSSLT
ncbi:hypothetical protein K438DRAFT_1765029 [Mycena galopus ATCC 62051]|nr:hypothetical protein K438DRAFT_1765029 [Mycena galopus ATCC 62051]